MAGWLLLEEKHEISVKADLYFIALQGVFNWPFQKCLLF